MHMQIVITAGQAVTRLFAVAGGKRFNSRAGQNWTVLPTACHRCDIASVVIVAQAQ